MMTWNSVSIDAEHESSRPVDLIRLLARGYIMPLLAFVTVGPGGRPVEFGALASSLKGRGLDVEPPESENDNGVIVFTLMGQLATVSHMPAPLPWTDLAGPASCAWHWREAEPTLRAHESHFIVGLIREDEPSVKRAVLLTLLIASVIECVTAATAVYWAAGTTVVPAERFLKSALEMRPDDLPLLSWIEFRVFRGEPADRWCLFTTGMQALGHMEIEVRHSMLAPQVLIDRVHDIAHYLTQAGAVLKDGDTVGESAEERMRIRHVPSAWEREGPVLQIEI
jgi:hypothetical protein